MATELCEIQNGLKSGDEEIRRSAIQALKGLPLTDFRGLIFCAMGDESWRVRKEAVETFAGSAPAETDIDKLLELLRTEDNAGLRNSAAEAVIRLGSSAVLPLIRMVSDPDADVRKFIIDLMGAIRDVNFVRPLLNALNDSDVNVASAAAEHLGSSGDPEVITEIIKAIETNPAVLFRFSALGALGSLGTLTQPSPVPVEILRLADQDILCKAVYDCLGSISDASSVTLLINGFMRKQKGSRSAALKALFRIYGRSDSAVKQNINAILRTLNGKNEISGLLNLFDRRDPALTESLIWCSVATGDIRFAPVLMESFVDERFSEAALKSLKSFGSEGIANVVRQYSVLNETAQCAICTLIGECGYSEYGDLITNALKENSTRVKMAAINSAAKLGMVSLIPDMVTLTDDTDSNVSSAAVSSLQLLALIDRPDILTVARQFCSSETPRQRRYACLLFTSLGEHEPLQLLAKDEDALVRQAAVTAIGNLRVQSSSTIPVMALVDEHPDVRIAAANALGFIKEKSSLDALEHALEDQDTWVRCAVLRAISQIDRDRTISVIKRLHTGAEGLFMITCLQLLEEDCGYEARQIIINALSSSDPDIARQASVSLERCSSKHKDSGCS